MKYISIFSGIEAASVAWEKLGWNPLAFSEIEQFPKAVLATRYPGVPDLGDITKIDWSDYVDTADVVVGGSPCQSFSIAGKREGLAGASGLMYEYIRAVRELRPKWFVWENVPGALSSERGHAFRQLLSCMDDLGYGMAWRVLDSQFFGVPQRRRRIFLIGHFGDQRAAEVLFERESMCGNLASSREKRQELTRRAKSSASIPSCLTHWDTQYRRVYSSDGVMSTLDARTGKVGADSKAVLCACDSGANSAIGYDIAPTITAHEEKSASYILQMNGAKSASYVFGADNAASGGLSLSNETSPTLGTTKTPAVKQASSVMVRRLTPMECERLQGFPCGWTDVTYKGKSAPDSARYKALGNSMAVPVMRWIGERIAKVEAGNE